MHEVTLDIKLEHVTISLVIMAYAPYVMSKAAYAIMRASPTDAAIRVCDKEAFIDFVRIVVIEMVNHTVAKVCCKDFSLLRVMDNKANASTRAIFSCIKFF